MITKIISHRNAQVIYEFDNGVSLSFIWGEGSYSDNLNNHQYTDALIRGDKYIDRFTYESKTVECYSIGANPNGIDEYLEEKYRSEQPIGYIPVGDIPLILAVADAKENK